MIISKQQGFAFLHIPKCGGTCIRRALSPSDGGTGQWWGRHSEPDGLELDLAHMTPATIRTRRQDVFREIDKLERYAILRDPEERLISSLDHYLANFYATSVARESQARLIELIREVEKIVADAPDPLPASMVHFTPQVRYVMLDGARYVPNLYRLNDLDRLRDDLNARHGTTIAAFGQTNRRENSDNVRFRVAAAEGLVWRVNKVVYSYTPKPVHTAVKTIGRALLTSRHGQNNAEILRKSAAFRRLLERVYAQDIELWAVTASATDRCGGGAQRRGTKALAAMKKGWRMSNW